MNTFEKLKNFLTLYKYLNQTGAWSAKAGTIDAQTIAPSVKRKMTFGETLAISDKLKSYNNAATKYSRFFVVYADGISQEPNKIPSKSLCVADKSVALDSLKRGDTIVLKLEGVNFEAYKIRMFTHADKDTIFSIKFDNRGVPSEQASTHPSNLYFGKLIYKLTT